jgi:DNA-binding response OmpR family regulator
MSDVTIELLQARLRQQAGRIAELEEELCQCRQRMISLTPLPNWVPRLTGKEEQVLRHLMARESITTSTLEYLLYGNDEPPMHIITIWIFKLRRKLEAHGIVIESIWHVGYRIPPDHRAALNDPESISPAQSRRPLGGGDNDHDRIATRDVSVSA